MHRKAQGHAWSRVADRSTAQSDVTGDAHMEAEKSREPVTLLDRDDFIDLLLEYYEELEPEHKSKGPLRKVWVPTE